MDMKITKRDAALLIGLAGVLIIVAVYYLLYLPLDEKKIALESENVTLQQRVNELQQMADNQSFYQSEIVRLTEENTTMMDQFPSDVREEDMVMLAVTLEQNSPWESVSSIAMTAAEERYVLGQKQAEEAAAAATAAAAEAEAAAGTDTAAAEAATATEPTTTDQSVAQAGTESALKTLYRKQAAITCQTDYDGFKNSLGAIGTFSDRRTIDSVTAVYDVNTGILASTTNVNMYYITGTDKLYTPPQIPSIQQGTDNIFGTISLIGLDEGQTTEDTTEDAAEE